MTLFLSLSLLLACDQEVSTDDTGSGDGGTPTGEGYTVTVSAAGATADVDISTLGTVQVNGETVAPLQALVQASGLAEDWAGSTWDFEASDGFRPSDRDCEPLAWETLAQGGIFLESGNLTWEDALDLPGCYYVNGVILFEAQP